MTTFSFRGQGDTVIRCPHCRRVHTNLASRFTGDEHTVRVECACGKTFELTRHVQEQYEARAT